MLRPVWVGVLVEMLSLFGSTSPFRFGFPSKSDALLEVEEVVVEAVAVHTISFNEFFYDFLTLGYLICEKVFKFPIITYLSNNTLRKPSQITFVLRGG